MRVGVMQGSLQDFDLASVLQVVGLGRQYTGVEVRLENGITGTVFVKSGRVVKVESEQRSGREALRELFELPRGDFFVYRSETPPGLPVPLGSLNDLLLNVQPRTTESEAASTSPQTRAPEASPKPQTIVEPTPTAAGPGSTLAERVGQIADHGTKRVVAVASPKGGCGKSTIALNLALSLARRGTSVLLVDTDLNSDVLSTLDARSKAVWGALDVALDRASLASAMLPTALPHFKIVPAIGKELPSLSALEGDLAPAFKKLFDAAARHAEVVVVDTPAGMLGTTRQVLSACTHVLGVLQAEVLAQRSFERFEQCLGLLDTASPSVLGVVINMLQTRHAASLAVFQDACGEPLARWLFDTAIPRNPAFLDAAQHGAPLRPLDDSAPPAVGFLFDNLASEVAQRLDLPTPERRPQPLLL